jgi:hypothetical protein
MGLLGGLLAACGLAASESLVAAADAGLQKLFGASVAESLADAEQAVRAYTGPLPPNHDLERALRCAQLTASLILVRSHAHALEGEPAGGETSARHRVDGRERPE